MLVSRVQSSHMSNFDLSTSHEHSFLATIMYPFRLAVVLEGCASARGRMRQQGNCPAVRALSHSSCEPQCPGTNNWITSSGRTTVDAGHECHPESGETSTEPSAGDPDTRLRRGYRHGCAPAAPPTSAMATIKYAGRLGSARVQTDKPATTHVLRSYFD